MELYTSLAKEFYRTNRKQILGIFIRDVLPDPAAVSNSSPLSPLPQSPVVEQAPGGPSVSNSYFATNLSSRFGEGNPNDLDSDEKSINAANLGRNTTVRASQQPSRQPPPLPPRLPPRRATEVSITRRGIITQQPLASEARFPQHQTSVDSVMTISSQISHTNSVYSQTAGKKNTALMAQTTLQKKRAEFDLRIARATSELPSDVVFRIFRDPEECIADADSLVDTVVGRVRF